MDKLGDTDISQAVTTVEENFEARFFFIRAYESIYRNYLKI